MNNELRIKPLLLYEVHYRTYANGDNNLNVDTFTADEVFYEGSVTVFRRTGNTIRAYFAPLEKIIISPVDDEKIPA